MGLENNKKEETLQNTENMEKENQNISLPDDALDDVSGGVGVDVKKVVKTAYKVIVH